MGGVFFVGKRLRESGNRPCQRNRHFCLLVLVVFLTGLLWAQLIPLAKADTVKKARFAGAFYPADPGELSRMINGFS